MHCGYLQKRNVPISPPSMQKFYSVLWGTLLLDYESEEDSKTSICPRQVSEILGISEWDGQGRANSYQNTFLLVTHTGVTYYLSAPSLIERDEWILQVKRALECNFGNSDVIPFKPIKNIQSKPSLSASNICGKTKNIINNIASATYCRSCGRPFSSSDYVQELTTLLQIGIEELEKVCIDCKNSQLVITWLKTLNYMHVMTLHEMTPAVLSDVLKFKSSFKIRRQMSNRLDCAARLLEEKSISLPEFEELRQVDHDYRRELVNEESQRLKRAIDAIGNDMLTLIGLLSNPASSEKGGRLSYFKIILKIMEIADKEPELVDFYWPQLTHVLLLESAKRTASSMVKVDLLQQTLLAISQKYPNIGFKLAWSLLAHANDYADKKITQVQYASSMSLLLQLDMAMTGIVSSIADVPTCKLLSQVVKASSHQQQEIAFELSTLLLTRRRLQECFDSEELASKKRVYIADTATGSYDNSNSNSGSSNSSSSSSNSNSSSSNNNDSMGNSSSSSSSNNSRASVLQLFNRLGVGEAETNRLSTDDTDSDVHNDRDVLNAASSLSSSISTNWALNGFGSQLDFISNLTNLVDTLRFVERPLRTETLCRELERLAATDDTHTGGSLGWDPTSIAGEPAYRITRVFVDECRVFRTKARAPSLLVYEVVRDDCDESYAAAAAVAAVDSHKHHHLRTFSSDQTEEYSQELKDADTLVDCSISQVIADINKIKLSPEKSHTHNSIMSLDDDAGVAIDSTSSNSVDVMTLQLCSPSRPRSIKRPSVQLPETGRSSFLSANRKISNFQSILGVANSTSEDDLQLLAETCATGNNSMGASTPSSTESPNGSGSGSSIGSSSSGVAGAVGNSNDGIIGDENPALMTKKVYESAKKLLDAGKIDHIEFESLIMGDSKYRVESKKEEETVVMTRVETAFGEPWDNKRERLLGDKLQQPLDDNSSNQSAWPVWDIRSVIVKSNDDLRQEVCCLQLMNLCQEIFVDFGLGSQLILKPYRIISTGSSTGIVEVLRNTMSLDALKKTAGFTSLTQYFRKTYGLNTETLNKSKRNFAASLAAYSLFTYILLIKDRHNGNILLDTEGHIVHVDFGFLLSIAPGGAFSLETAPFKLTEEMVDVLGGLESPLFGEFVKAFTAGFLALRVNAENIVSNLQILATASPFPCFYGKDSVSIIDKLRSRFRLDLSVKETVLHCLDLIIASYGHMGTRQYDAYQWYTNGIMT